MSATPAPLPAVTARGAPGPTESMRPAHVLPVIVASQLGGTSLWFAGNAVLDDLRRSLALDGSILGWMTSSVQLGFIVGTLVLALTGLADRLPAPRVFLVSAWVGAVCNLGLLWAGGLVSVLVLRFLTGICLAGIYPIGMKIAAGWYRRGLGRAIGYLVAALVLGTALPHLLRALGRDLPWQAVIVAVSLAAVLGGVAMVTTVGDGPHVARPVGQQRGGLLEILRVPRFRASVLGYFGHMWELYTLWTFVPALLAAHASCVGRQVDISLWSFVVIAAGAVGCVSGGRASQRQGSARVARRQLSTSGVCCLVLPWSMAAPTWVFLAFLCLWGATVVGDSPQLSTLVARTVPPDRVGVGLTLSTSVGFALTVASIETVSALSRVISLPWALATLVVGPVIGLVALRPLVRAGL